MGGQPPVDGLWPRPRRGEAKPRRISVCRSQPHPGGLGEPSWSPGNPGFRRRRTWTNIRGRARQARSSACADGSRQLIITLDHACPWRNGWRAEGSSGWEAELVCWTGPQIRMAAAGWTRCRFDPAGADTVVIAEPGGERRRRGWKPLTTVGPVAPIRAERNAGGRIDGYWARPGSWRPVRMLGPVNRSFPTT